MKRDHFGKSMAAIERSTAIRRRSPSTSALVLAGFCASSALACAGSAIKAPTPAKLSQQAPEANPKAPEAKPLSLVEHPFFSGSADYIRTSADTLQRGSLNVDILAEIIRDRLQKIAIQETTKKLATIASTQAAGFPLREVIEQAVPIFTTEGAIQRDKVEVLVNSVVRAVIATYLMNRLPSAGGLDIAQMAAWDKGKSKNKPTANEEDVTWARYQLIALTYWWLGYTGLLSTKDTKLPSCDAKDGLRQAFCKDIPKTEKECAEWLVKYAKIDSAYTALRGLSLIARKGSAEKDPIDIEGFIKAIGETTAIANFDKLEGLKLAQWSDVFGKIYKTNLVKGAENVADLIKTFESLINALKARNLAGVQQAATVLKDKMVSDTAADGVKSYFSAEYWNDLEKAVGTLATSTKDPWDTLPQPIAFYYYADDPRKTPFADVAGTLKAIKSSIGSLADAEQTIRKVLAGRRSLDEIDFQSLAKLVLPITNATTDIENISKSLRDLNQQPDPALARIARDFGALKEVVKQLVKLDLPEVHAKTVGQVVDELRALGPRVATLQRALSPALELIAKKKQLDTAAIVAIVQRIEMTEMLAAFGIDMKSCNEGQDGAPCWGAQILRVLRDSIEANGNSLKVDGTKLADGLSTLGDDFKRRSKGGWYFHLTVGLGGIYAIAPPEVVETTVNGVMTRSQVVGASRFAPLAAEQIGVGYASQTYAGDWVTLKAGGFASGLLYRATISSTESQAVMGGLFGALDIKELVEVYAAGVMMWYPSIGSSSYPLRPGFTVGVQVPLGDYLKRNK